MSSRASKIRKRVGRLDPLYNSSIGSVVATISILTGHSPEDARQLFMKMRKLGNKLPCKTIRDLCDYVYAQYGYAEERPYDYQIVLVWDSLGARSPMVTFIKDGHLMPIDPKGFHEINTLSLAAQGRDWAVIEGVYDDTDDEDDES